MLSTISLIQKFMLSIQSCLLLLLEFPFPLKDFEGQSCSFLLFYNLYFEPLS